MIATWSKGLSDDNMPEQLLVETLGLVRRHPWWSARAALALTVLERNGIVPPAAVLDVGCGWGINLDALEKQGYQAAGLDISRQVLGLIDRPGRNLIEADLNQPPPAIPQPCQALLLLDVLEHLDDDRGTLRRLAPLVRPNGLVIVSVPALPELFSEFDRVQGHRRRYVPETLRAAFESSGFAVKELFWWGAWMVPILNRMRREKHSASVAASKTYADHLRLPPWPAPWFMKMLYAWEKSRALNGRLKTGTSLFAVGIRAD